MVFPLILQAAQCGGLEVTGIRVFSGQSAHIALEMHRRGSICRDRAKQLKSVSHSAQPASLAARFMD